jgi:hypothetical protein
VQNAYIEGKDHPDGSPVDECTCHTAVLMKGPGKCYNVLDGLDEYVNKEKGDGGAVRGLRCPLQLMWEPKSITMA